MHRLSCSAHGPAHNPSLCLGAGGYLWVWGQDPYTCRPGFKGAASCEKEDACGGRGVRGLSPGSWILTTAKERNISATQTLLPSLSLSDRRSQPRGDSCHLCGFQLQKVLLSPVSEGFGTDTRLLPPTAWTDWCPGRYFQLYTHTRSHVHTGEQGRRPIQTHTFAQTHA